MDLWRERRGVAYCGAKVALVGNYGLLGQWLVRKLLERGYTVHSALGCSPEEAAEMMAMPGAEQRLELKWRDLLDYTSITDVIEGCSAVYLTIPPCESLNGLPDYPAEVVDAEVRGTLNVVEACSCTATVKRLILTSSASAVALDARHNHNMTGTEKSIDERCWSNVDFCRKSKAWSALAKTVAEKAAWSLARDRGVKLVVMNPAIVIGPDSGTTKRYESSDALFSNIIEGLGSGVMAFAHVDTVADAHVLAMESLDASGRFLCFERMLTENEVVGLMKRFSPNQSLSSPFFTHTRVDEYACLGPCPSNAGDRFLFSEKLEGPKTGRFSSVIRETRKRVPTVFHGHHQIIGGKMFPVSMGVGCYGCSIVSDGVRNLNDTTTSSIQVRPEEKIDVAFGRLKQQYTPLVISNDKIRRLGLAP